MANEPNANPIGPNTNPNASLWNMVCIGYERVGFRLGMSISCCLSHFRLHWVAKASVVSGGIWALVFQHIFQQHRTILARRCKAHMEYGHFICLNLARYP